MYVILQLPFNEVNFSPPCRNRGFHIDSPPISNLFFEMNRNFGGVVFEINAVLEAIALFHQSPRAV
ncbi:MAG: hypothetical protein V7K40_33560 [Nostoc sp.]